MKKLVKLLLILPLLFIVSISAKEIDMNGEPFTDDKFYESGDIYKNVHVINGEYAVFKTYKEKLFYRVSLVSGTDASPNNKVGVGHSYNIFYPYEYNRNESIFGLEYNVPTSFLIPYYHEDAVLWTYRSGNVGMEEQVIIEEWFNYFMNKPYYTVECGNSVKYGESTSCDLYLNFEQYGEGILDLLFYLIDSDFTFKVSSNDYQLYNVRVNEDTRFTYNNGIVSGQLFDFNNIRQYKEDIRSIDEDIIIKIIKEFQKHGELTNSCTGEIDLDGHMRSSLGGATTVGSASTCISKNKYKIKVLTLDITPLNNETKDGIITLSDMDMNIAEYDEEGNVKRVSGKLEEIDDTIVPMISIENVKGVEENPKTGLFNYLLLIIPITLLGIGFNLLRKINVFKKI